MKAVVFGVTGQDGSHLAELLLEKGYDVVGVTRHSSVDNTSRLTQAKKSNRFKLVEGDVTDAHSVREVLSYEGNVDRAHEIYNLAAQSHVSVSFKQPALTWDVTGKGCLNILQTIVDLGLECRFYQASSSEMFGASYNLGANGEKYQDEDTKFMPQSPYAIAKCAAHYMTRLFREAYGVHASSGILFNHEGERRGETFVTRKITKWIGDFHRWCEANNTEVDDVRECKILECLLARDSSFPKLRLGNLEAFRDWGYAKDFVEAMWLMLQQPAPDDYVICTGETHTIRDFLDAAFSTVGIDDWSPYVVIDPQFYRPVEVDYLRGRNDKAANVLGWRPRHSFRELVELMVKHDLRGDAKDAIQTV